MLGISLTFYETVVCRLLPLSGFQGVSSVLKPDPCHTDFQEDIEPYVPDGTIRTDDDDRKS